MFEALSLQIIHKTALGCSWYYWGFSPPLSRASAVLGLHLEAWYYKRSQKPPQQHSSTRMPLCGDKDLAFCLPRRGWIHSSVPSIWRSGDQPGTDALWPPSSFTLGSDKCWRGRKTCGLHILHQKYYLARTVSMVLKIDICLVGVESESWQKSSSTNRNYRYKISLSSFTVSSVFVWRPVSGYYTHVHCNKK